MAKLLPIQVNNVKIFTQLERWGLSPINQGNIEMISPYFLRTFNIRKDVIGKFYNMVFAITYLWEVIS
jgi:hypothetical protein